MAYTWNVFYIFVFSNAAGFSVAVEASVDAPKLKNYSHTSVWKTINENIAVDLTFIFQNAN